MLPSVVQIRSGDALGSGVVYDARGHIVTNAHVVGDAKKFQVTTANSEAVLSASLVSSYPEQDLAVIKLDKVPPGLKPAVFGIRHRWRWADRPRHGLAARVVLERDAGDRFGDRTDRQRGVTNGTGATIANMVQTSAAINPGNSGGALVNLDSQVIGIPTLAAVDPDLGGGAAPGIGFAIPASTVRTIADQIIKSGKVTASGRAALGITGRTVVNSSYQPVGVAVVEVRGGGAADGAGLRAGDIITKLGDTGITTMTSLAEALADAKPGQKTTITYRRGGSTKNRRDRPRRAVSRRARASAPAHARRSYASSACRLIGP